MCNWERYCDLLWLSLWVIVKEAIDVKGKGAEKKPANVRERVGGMIGPQFITEHLHGQNFTTVVEFVYIVSQYTVQHDVYVLQLK